MNSEVDATYFPEGSAGAPRWRGARRPRRAEIEFMATVG